MVAIGQAEARKPSTTAFGEDATVTATAPRRTTNSTFRRKTRTAKENASPTSRRAHRLFARDRIWLPPEALSKTTRVESSTDPEVSLHRDASNLRICFPSSSEAFSRQFASRDQHVRRDQAEPSKFEATRSQPSSVGGQNGD